MNAIQQAMLQAAEDVFASAAFMFPAEAPAEAGASQPTVQAVARFSGPVNGALLLSVPPDLAEPLARNMLGLDDQEPLPPEHAQDALAELLNVICGNLLPSITSPHDVYDIQRPEVLDPQDRFCAPELPHEFHVPISLDQAQVDLTLLLDRLPCLAPAAAGGGGG